MEKIFHPHSEAVLEELAREAFDAKEWFDLKTLAERLSTQDGFERLLCADTLRVKLFRHQEQAALRVLKEMRGRAVLADEVGLGKTIEAGVILKEYLLRSLVDRVLILTPPSLVSQWRLELKEKLDLDFSVARSPKDFEERLRIVASIDTAKRPPASGIIHGLKWDMVIVDEAHRLKDSRTLNWRFVNGIQKKYLLLLTATPVQNDLKELYNLVTLLKPGQLKTFSQFKRAYMLDRHSPKNTYRLREALSEVMVRTARHETMIRFRGRRVRSLAVAMDEAERRFHEEILALLRSAYRSMPRQKRNVLPLIVVLRESASHPFAALATLEAMARRAKFEAVTQEKIDALRALAAAFTPAKLASLVAEVCRAPEPCIVFTEFRQSQREIARALGGAGVRAHLYHGGLSSAAKDEVIEAFRRGGGVLISTEAGGEGRNLQFCRRLINYDLPWNPMRVEQRIGRVHRLGQEREVEIVNLVTEGTIDSYVLYLLEKKIDMFHKVIGEIDAILADVGGNFQERIGAAALESRSDEELRERIEAFGREIERARRAYENAQRLNARLFDGGEEAHGPLA